MTIRDLGEQPKEKENGKAEAAIAPAPFKGLRDDAQDELNRTLMRQLNKKIFFSAVGSITANAAAAGVAVGTPMFLPMISVNMLHANTAGASVGGAAGELIEKAGETAEKAAVKEAMPATTPHGLPNIPSKTKNAR